MITAVSLPATLSWEALSGVGSVGSAGVAALPGPAERSFRTQSLLWSRNLPSASEQDLAAVPAGGFAGAAEWEM